MPRAMLVFHCQADGSWLPTTVILATPDRLEGRCLPGDENRDARLARLLDHHAVPPRGEDPGQLGTYEDWIDWALDHLANGHTTWTTEGAPATTVGDLFERECSARCRRPRRSPRPKMDAGGRALKGA